MSLNRRFISCLLALTMAAGLLAGCAAGGGTAAPAESDAELVDLGPLLDESVPLSGSPAISTVLKLSHPGSSTHQNGSAVIDYSNTPDGYVMAAWTAGGSSKIKVLIKGPSGVQYQYNLRTAGEYEAFPLSDGSGSYTVGIYQNVSGNQYAPILSGNVSAQLTDEFAPFLRPNQYVNFTENSKAVAKGAELCQGITDNLKKVEKIYDYVVNNLTYDTQKAASVQSGYLPNVDAVMDSGKGICFDYAALMASMLRSQEVPCKLVVGYTGDVYHAWINVWSEEDGWVEGLIYFDGKVWKLMDPTFASSGNQSNKIMEYIGNGANYKAKYLY